ncbi:MAG: hypothetical protein LUO93_07565 [Methanomicrobiales archaeon]|nr:hypothetical protein [Methanomicrobiales archaeon]
MENVTEKRTVKEVKELLKVFLSDLGIEIVQEVDRGTEWGFWIRFGSFPLIIQNPPNASYTIIALHLSVTSEQAVKRLNEIYDTGDTHTVFELTRAFSTPITGFSRIIARGRVTGYAVTKYIFPYHAGFSIEDFDVALQAVVSVGALGVSYLKTLVSEVDLEHCPITPPPSLLGGK